MSEPSAESAGRTPDRGRDLGVALGLLFLEVPALLVIFGVWYLSGVSFDPGRPGTFDSLSGYLWAAGVVGAAALAAAVLASRKNARATVWSQSFIALLVVVVIMGGVAAEQHERRLQRPSPGSTFSGQIGCRSGGDNSECPHTGG